MQAAAHRIACRHLVVIMTVGACSACSGEGPHGGPAFAHAVLGNS
jgi:hypothetical protein